MNVTPVVIIPAYQPGDRLVQIASELLADAQQDLIIVDDGSATGSQAVFERLSAHPRVKVLRHATNLGKGQALKTAFNDVLLTRSTELPGVVTADADGQHLVADIRQVSEALRRRPDTLCLGSRDLTGSIPWKSAVGNALTRFVFRRIIGAPLKDTQTGLRGIPLRLLPELLRIPATRYEFELEMLVLAARLGVRIIEVPIATVYEANNRSTHFDPLWDSLRVYFVFLRFVGLSLATAALDFAVFGLAHTTSGNILGSTVAARTVAGTFNFHFARKVVFQSPGRPGLELLKYVVLVAWLMLVSYGLVTALVIFLGFGVYAAKLLAETSLFLTSFALQRLIVFAREPAVAE